MIDPARARLADGLNVAPAVWLIIAPWTYGFGRYAAGNADMTRSSVLVGVIIAVCSAIRFAYPHRGTIRNRRSTQPPPMPSAGFPPLPALTFRSIAVQNVMTSIRRYPELRCHLVQPSLESRISRSEPAVYAGV
jgi:hypothetical protein